MISIVVISKDEPALDATLGDIARERTLAFFDRHLAGTA